MNVSSNKHLTVTTITSAFNEEATIVEIIKRLKKFPLASGLKKEIIVVNNGSTDNTGKILKNIKGIKLLTVRNNKGKGDGLKRGFKAATGDIIVIQDADLEYDPQEIPRLVDPIIRGKSQVVYGSRIKRRRPVYLSAAYYYGNVFITKIFNWLYGQSLTDISTAYKAFTKNFIDSIKLTSPDFGFDFEVSAKAAKQKIKIAEVSVSYHPRSYQEGKKITPVDGLKALRTIFKLRFLDE